MMSPEEDVEFAKFFYDLSVVRERDRSETRRPVNRADVEFGNAVPSEAKERISVNPREFNVINKGHVTQAQT